MMDSDGSNFFIGEKQPSHVTPRPSAVILAEYYKQFDRNRKSLNTKCKIMNITKVRGNPIFHFEMNGKIYNYGIKGIRADYKISLKCTKNSAKNLKVKCGNISFIFPTETLALIIQDKPKEPKCTIYNNSKYTKFLDNSDDSVYDINNYDINTFEIFGNHKCAGTKLRVYFQEIEKSEHKKILQSLRQTFSLGQAKIKSKLLKIIKIHTRLDEHPHFHFEINEKIYFYGFRRFKKDGQIVLQCQNSTCGNISYILPSDFLKLGIQNAPSDPRVLDKSDPRVYDINSYNINSLFFSKTNIFC